MQIDEKHSDHAGSAGATGVARPPLQIRRNTSADGVGGRPASRRWAAVAWIGGGLALFAVLLRISLRGPLTSDAANNALQAWDMLHGHVLLHGWLIGDATYYTFELPLYAITEFFFGLQTAVNHLVAALTYVLVAACAVAIARANSTGPAALARCGVALAVLAVPLLAERDVLLVLGSPDHFGTSAILLGSFLLIDRAPDRRFTAPLLGVILCAGQLGDATVRYVAVPAVLAVCVYRVLAARKIRTGDAAIALAAAVSVPLASLTRAVLLHFGAYSMIPPKVGFSSPSIWPHHVSLALLGIRTIYGAMIASPATTAAVAAAAFGLACMLAAAVGSARVVWTWRKASRAEQLVFAAIVVNVAVYVVSVIPGLNNAREIVAVLPCGAVLAARLVPARIASATRARLALGTAVLAAVLPLAIAASGPPATSPTAPIAAWLEAHGLTYGIAGYWDASVITVQSGNEVQVVAVKVGRHLRAGSWETNAAWYNASLHNATFVIADPVHTHGYPLGFVGLGILGVEKCLGRPVAIDRVAGRVILIYRTNLLKLIVHLPRPEADAT